VHALRIPFEGMLGSYTPAGIPFVAATWGNDLTLHARRLLFDAHLHKTLPAARGMASPLIHTGMFAWHGNGVYP
jgi:hypothetical protein